MRFRAILAILLTCALTGCPSERKGAKNKSKLRETEPTKDQSGDVAFQSFVGRLRIAVERRDLKTLASMMTSDFGYRWDTPPAGESPFEYWERTNAWGELTQLMRQRWVPYDGFMVVPPELATQPDYAGYRAGVRMVSGSWRFAYFVPAPPAEAPAPPSPVPTDF